MSDQTLDSAQSQHSHQSPDFQQAAELARAVLTEVSTVVVGKEQVLKHTLAGILAGGHVLFEDVPGLAKTLTASSFAKALGLEYNRAQFTPDLLPSDLTGSEIFHQGKGEFFFRPGPIFAGLLLADEINRTPPKTQAALLESMQEKQVTVEGTTHPLPKPFHVLATANPVETEGTYPLPEAQLDRFLMRLSFGYPTLDEEWEVLSRHLGWAGSQPQVKQILDPSQLLQLQAVVNQVEVAEPVGRYAIELVQETRQHSQVHLGSSPRGSLALIQCARALAVIKGRGFVIPEDIKELAKPCLRHRIMIKPELWLHNIHPDQVLDSILEKVATPEVSAV